MSVTVSQHSPWVEWAIEQPIDFEVGESYIVRANHESGLYWCDLLIEITEKTPGGNFGFKALTMLDGSPGMLDGWLSGRNDN